MVDWRSEIRWRVVMRCEEKAFWRGNIQGEDTVRRRLVGCAKNGRQERDATSRDERRTKTDLDLNEELDLLTDEEVEVSHF